ncbi:hypothetical protein [Aeromonas veronii]|uniref:hypothetical protein n=1 Tax=Aeromonas veronii TaxID=654 RepID=UPI003BA2E301
MRLHTENLETSEQLEEFDQWLTAKLERIKDSEKFNTEIKSLCECIQSISGYLDNFSDYAECSVENLCDAVINASDSYLVGDSFLNDEKRITGFYEAFFNLLFLTSGATDNNLKNHFLIKLKDAGITPKIPKKSGSKKNYVYRLSDIPPVTKSDFIARSLASCFVGSHEKYHENVKTEPFFNLKYILVDLLREYVGLILEDHDETIQFWAICHSYIELNKLSSDLSLGKYLLNSCTIFKVRGSASASGGHITEDILRRKLEKIGLRPGYDFNLSDVNVDEGEFISGGDKKNKTRAYDFILPYKVDNWEPKPKLFIQSQFYAGDSGSVSHKVVDQTKSSRAFTLQKYPAARFVEYLDGAGYCASLRGDLKHMLSYENTASFFQVKSILVRLRREFQYIEYLTPIEFEHAVLASEDGAKSSVFNALLADGYPLDEIERIASVCFDLGYVVEKNSKLEVSPARLEIARRLLILDVAANNAYKITDLDKKSQKYLLVPGYGNNYGLLESELTSKACSICKQISITAPVFVTDIEWLLDEGVIKRR